MKVNVAHFLEEADIKDPFYPGKRLVKQCKQQGDFKSHCVVMDWRTPEKIHIDIKAGLSGRDMEPKDLKNYPICFQSPTFIEIKVTNDNKDDNKDDDEEEEEGKSSKGKGGSGGKKPEKKKLEDIDMISSRFGDSVEGKIPEMGEIVDMMVMGMKIAKEAFESVFNQLTQQIKHTKISATELLAKASNIITRVQPPSFLKPKGDETAKYKYDRERNADIGFTPGLG